MYVYVCGSLSVCSTCMHMSEEARRGCKPPGACVASGCELIDMVAGNSLMTSTGAEEFLTLSYLFSTSGMGKQVISH